ncbi:MAG: ribonuclease P protein component [Rikenellaceae bacterium]|jgi:ribonuclease P protein component|nr:ribonuclease P protein component [Rikenellaceae bacterium]
MDAINYSFDKKQRLTSRTLIQRLFGEGASFFAYPLRCISMVVDPDPHRPMAPVQVLVSVSKKNHKRAVARNLVKRRLREAYRLNRHRWGTLPLPDDKRLIVALVYTSREILDYTTIEHGVIKVITEIQKRLAAGGDLSAGSTD